MVGVVRVDRDPGTNRPGVCVSMRVKLTALGARVGVLGDEHAPDPGPGPERLVVGRRPRGRDHVVACAVAERGRGQVLADRHPVAARGPAAGRSSALQRVDSRDGSAPPLSSVRQTCSMPDEHAAADVRVGDERHVERAVLLARPAAGRRCRSHSLRVVAVEVHLRRRVVVVVVAGSSASSGVEAGLAAVAADALEPGRVDPCRRTCRCPACRRAGSPRRIARVDRQRLELDRVEPVVDRRRSRTGCRSAGAGSREVGRLERLRRPAPCRSAAAAHAAESSTGCGRRSAPRRRRSRRTRCRGSGGVEDDRVLVGMDALRDG